MPLFLQYRGLVFSGPDVGLFNFCPLERLRGHRFNSPEKSMSVGSCHNRLRRMAPRARLRRYYVRLGAPMQRESRLCPAWRAGKLTHLQASGLLGSSARAAPKRHNRHAAPFGTMPFLSETSMVVTALTVGRSPFC